MSFTYALSSLTFSDGTTIELSDNDILLLVGPNNAGKSATLKEIITLLEAAAHQTTLGLKVLKSLRMNISKEREAFEELVSSVDLVPNTPGHVGRMGQTVQIDSLFANFANTDWVKQILRPYCVKHVDTENRLSVTRSIPAIDVETQIKGHPFHYLYDDDVLENDLSAVFAKAFGTDLVVNRFAGVPIHLHVGSRPLSPTAFNVDRDFREALRKLPFLHEQGDGMRAFVGCLMWATVVDYSMILIDEPEAFLHPPQARLLGRTLVVNKRSGRQLIMSTHSGDLLRGMLDANPKNLRILRIVRDGNVNRVTELAPTKVKELWDDPILRQSNPLDGLFHSRVVLCEGDADCQFYASIANALAENVETRVPPDALFLHCGGKDRMPKVLQALRTLNVPVDVIADFDILRDKNPLKPVFESIGGRWEEVERDWIILSNAISSMKMQLDTNDFRGGIFAILKEIKSDTVPESALDDIRDLAKRASAWSNAKRAGKALIPSGDPSSAYGRLEKALSQFGLRVVPVGELERFCKTVSDHGPRWVGEVMKKDLGKDPELREAREFIEAIFWPDG